MGGLWEKAKKAWGAVGHAFDLQQLLALVGVWQLVGVLLGGVGGAAVAFFSQFPAWGIILAAAVGVGVGLFIVNEITSRRVQTRVQRQSAEAPTTPTSINLDPHHQIFTKIMRVDFTGLFADHDPHIDFVVYVKQTSDWTVKITDVRGRMTIGGTECSLPAHLSGTHPRVLRDPHGFYDCTVRQPLTQEMAHAMYWDAPYGALDLRSQDSRVNVSLAGLTWVGTVALPQGEVALPERAVCDEAFTVLGPISEVDADKVFVRGGVFLSSQVWRHHESGLLRDRE